MGSVFLVCCEAGLMFSTVVLDLQLKDAVVQQCIVTYLDETGGLAPLQRLCYLSYVNLMPLQMLFILGKGVFLLS